MRPTTAPPETPALASLALALSGRDWASLSWLSWALEEDGLELTPSEVSSLAASDPARRYEVDGDLVRLRPASAVRGAVRSTRPAPRRLYVGLVGPDAEMALIVGVRRGVAPSVHLAETADGARGLAFRRGFTASVFEVDGTRLSYHTDVERSPDGGWSVDYVPPRLLTVVSTEPLAAVSEEEGAEEG